MKVNHHSLPYFILLLPPLFWAGNFVVGRAVSGSEAPLGLSFYRWLIALIIFLPFCIKPIWSQRHIIKKNIVGLFILSFLGVAGFNSFAYIALQSTTATNATLLNSFIPIFILLISGLVLKENIALKQVLGIIVSMIGVLALLSQLDIDVLLKFKINNGDLWMLVASLDWALYSICLKFYRPPDLSSIAFLGISMMIGTLILYPIYVYNPFNEPIIIWDHSMLQAILYIAIFPSLIAYLAWNYGIKKIGASKGGQFIHLMPFIGAILATIFLNERLQIYHVVGGLFIGLGLWLSLSNKHKV